MRELLRTKHFLVTLDEAAHVVRRARNGERFASVPELEAEYEVLLRTMDSVDRPRLAQLIDVRHAPPRNDPEFEAVVERYHPALYRDFRGSAVLVQSAAGKLQVQRMFVETGVNGRAFTDEEKALEYLAEVVAAPR